MSSYPGGTDALTNPASGDHLNSPSHSAQHLNSNDAIEAIESATGTHSGTNILMNFVSGQFPVRNTGGGAIGTLVQTLVGGTLSSNSINNGTLGTPTINIGSDASGDTYYRNASNVFTRLAIGAAG